MWARAGGGARTTALFAFVAVVSLGALVAALVSQHLYDMQPCPWCVLQRLVFCAIAVFALLGLVWRGAAGGRVAGTFAHLLAFAGIAAALWQQLVAAKSASCNLTLADRIVNATTLDRLLPDVFEARASCADAAVSLLGVPYAYWAAAVFALCAIALLRILYLSA
jgi:disulfide bond formation protein DsbB